MKPRAIFPSPPPRVEPSIPRAAGRVCEDGHGGADSPHGVPLAVDHQPASAELEYVLAIDPVRRVTDPAVERMPRVGRLPGAAGAADAAEQLRLHAGAGARPAVGAEG